MWFHLWSSLHIPYIPLVNEHSRPGNRPHNGLIFFCYISSLLGCSPLIYEEQGLVGPKMPPATTLKKNKGSPKNHLRKDRIWTRYFTKYLCLTRKSNVPFAKSQPKIILSWNTNPAPAQTPTPTSLLPPQKKQLLELPSGPYFGEPWNYPWHPPNSGPPDVWFNQEFARESYRNSTTPKHMRWNLPFEKGWKRGTLFHVLGGTNTPRFWVEGDIMGL